MWCDVMWCDVMWCNVMWCDMMWCDVMWCDVMWCDVMWYDVMWCDVMWCDVIWYDVMWCDVVWCGVMWCDVLWRDLSVSHNTRLCTTAHEISFPNHHFHFYFHFLMNHYTLTTFCSWDDPVYREKVTEGQHFASLRISALFRSTTFCIRTENQNWISFYPFVIREISVLIDLTFRGKGRKIDALRSTGRFSRSCCYTQLHPVNAVL